LGTKGQHVTSRPPKPIHRVVLCGNLDFLKSCHKSHKNTVKYSCFYVSHVRGRDSSVGIVTHYGLDGPGIESWWGARFFAPVQTGHGPHSASYTVGTGYFRGVKRPGRCIDHPPPCSAKVEGRVDLYLCSTYEPLWPVIGWTLPLCFSCQEFSFLYRHFPFKPLPPPPTLQNARNLTVACPSKRSKALLS
jgi:hypothetical protein